MLGAGSDTTLTPVDYDPFKVKLTPVEGDPFVKVKPAYPSDYPSYRPPTTTPGFNARGDSTPGSSQDATHAFVRTAGRQVLPSLAGGAGFGGGFVAGGVLGAPLGPLDIIPALLGGLAGAYGANRATNYVQDKALEAAPTGLVKAIGQDPVQAAADQQGHPVASFLGGVAPNILLAGPGAVTQAPATASLLTRALSHPVGGRAIGATLGGGMEAAREGSTGEGLDPLKIGGAAAAGALLNKPTALGNELFTMGGNAVIAGAQMGARQAGNAYRATADAAGRARERNGSIDGEFTRIDPSEPLPPGRRIAGPVELTPVEGDPFAAPAVQEPPRGIPPAVQSPSQPIAPAGAPEASPAAPSAITLTPVEGDPFAVPTSSPQPAVSTPSPPAGEPQPVAVPEARPVDGGGLRPDPGPLGDGEHYVSTPAGNRIRAKFEVVPAASLTAASGDLQNRDRTRDSSDLQTNDIVANFDPSRLGESAETDRGAPIVGPDNVVESGNGRILALNRIYSTPETAHHVQAYREYIGSLGHDAAGIENPVLIRRRTNDFTPEQRKQFTDDSNKAATMSLTSVERAKMDSDALDSHTLDLYRGGDIGHAGNGDFVRAFNSRLTPAERAAMVDEHGQPSQDAITRIENALMARAYENPGVLSKLMEARDNNIRSIGAGMLDQAAPWARLRAAVKAGEVKPEYDVTDKLVDAARRVSDARARGEKPTDILSQADAFNPMDPITEQFIRAFHNSGLTRAASREAIGDILSSYAKRASEQTTGARLFGGDEATTPEELLHGVLADHGHGSNEGGLLAAAEDRAPAASLADEMEKRLAARKAARLAREPVEEPKARERPTLQPEPAQDAETPPQKADNDTDAPSRERGDYQPSFVEAAYTNRQSVYDSAVRAIGMEPDRFNLLMPARKVRLLQDALEKLTGIKAAVAPDMPLQHAIDQLLDAHQTLQGMADVLGIVPKTLSLGGQLSLRLVKKARFLGSYSNGQITLPGRSNSFSHEWAHGLDYHLLDRLTEEQARGITGLIRNEGADFYPRTVQQAFVKLLNAMFFDGAAIAQKVMALQKQIETTVSDKRKAALRAQIDNVLSGRSKAHEKSRYWQGANDFNKSGPGDYWTQPTEMFARAFEAWVSFKMANESFGTEFVGKGNDNYLSDADDRFAKAFPKGEERVAIFDAMQQLMDVLNKEQIIQDSRTGEVTATSASDFHTAAESGPNPQAVKQEGGRAQNRARRMVDAIFGADLDAMEIGRHNRNVDADDAKLRAVDPVKLLSKINNVRSLAFSAAADGVKMIGVRWNSKAVQTIHDHFAHDLGGTRRVDRTWSKAIMIRENKALNPTYAVLERLGKSGWVFKKLTKAQDDVLAALLTGKDAVDDMGLRPLASAMRRAFNDEWYANQQAGIDLGYLRDSAYLNRQIDTGLVAGDPDKFLTNATEAYGLAFDRDVGADAAEIAGEPERLQNFIDIAANLKADGIKELRKTIRDKAETDDIAAAVETMLEDVRSAYALMHATAYRDAILHTDTFPDFTMTSTLPNSEKRRSLPAEADELLRDFYNPSPVSALTSYVLSSVRRTEWASRFGKDGEIAKKLDRKMAQEGVPESDRRYVWQLADRMAGRYKRTGLLANPGVVSALSVLRAKGTLAMMGRAVTLSFFEPMSMGIVTGNVGNGLRAVAKTWANVLLKGSRDEMMEWSRANGFIRHHMLEQMQALDRFGTASDTPTKVDRLPGWMFRSTGLTFLTNASDAAVIDVGRRSTINDMSHRVVVGGDRGKEAARLMSELGIRDPGAFAQQIVDMNGAMPSEEWMASSEGWDYATALQRIADMTIQKPDASELAPLGRNPLASYATYSITAFIQSSYRNLLKRNVKIGMRLAGGGEIGNLAAMVAGTVGSVALLYALNFLASSVREMLFNPDRQEEWGKDGHWLRNNLALTASRTFSFGALDPMINAWSGLRWKRDLAYLPLGAYAGADAQNATKMASAFGPGNSPKKNTAEHNALKAFYGFAIAPAVSAVASLNPGGPIAMAAAGTVISSGTSPQAGDAFATMLVGEKGTKTPKPGIADAIASLSREKKHHKAASH